MTLKEVPDPGSACAVHENVTAQFQCTGCGATLCDGCINVTKYLVLCGLCGERAVPLPGVPDPTRQPPEPPRMRLVPGEAPAASPAIQLTHHVVVPGAIIAMVTALLFFLVDLRSVFLPMGGALKWIGFWYVVATVLIARYGRLSADRERQGCYTAALTLAMLTVLLVAPWAAERDALGFMVNVAIVLAVWQFASRVTGKLSREGEDETSERDARRLYGKERLELEAWERQQDDARIKVRRALRKQAKARRRHGDAHGNPNAAVAPLVVAALVLFAVGEPFVMAGVPEVGESALAAMVVFLLSAALVLAAGSAIGTLRHAKRLRGKVAERLVPARIVTAGLLMVVLLTVALLAPGVAYRGSGELRPEGGVGESSSFGDPGEPSDSGDPGEESDTSEAELTDEGESAGVRRGSESEQQTGSAPPGESAGSAAGKALSGATQMLDLLTSLGKFLFLPFLIALALGGLYVLARIAPFLAKMKLTGWRGWLARLAALLGGRRKKKDKRRGPRLSGDIALDGLRDMPPREAIVTGYARLLLAFQGVGYPREKRTPYEIVEGLPGHLRRLRQPLESLTALYVRAAYGTDEMEDRDRREAVSALADIKSQMPAA